MVADKKEKLQKLIEQIGKENEIIANLQLFVLRLKKAELRALKISTEFSRTPLFRKIPKTVRILRLIRFCKTRFYG